MMDIKARDKVLCEGEITALAVDGCYVRGGHGSMSFVKYSRVPESPEIVAAKDAILQAADVWQERFASRVINRRSTLAVPGDVAALFSAVVALRKLTAPVPKPIDEEILAAERAVLDAVMEEANTPCPNTYLHEAWQKAAAELAELRKRL
jgi:hypothetical protein